MSTYVGIESPEKRCGKTTLLCIVIRMQRKTAKEECERLRQLETATLRRQCARFVQDHASAIASINIDDFRCSIRYIARYKPLHHPLQAQFANPKRR